MTKINSLTAEQEIRLPQFRDEWFRIGCSTAPADRPRAEAAITEMYRIIGKDKPQFIWFDSPATCILGRDALLQAGNTKLADQSSLESPNISL